MRKFHVAVPTVLAVIAIVAGIRASGLEVFTSPAYTTVELAPTPYSNAHAVVQSRPGNAEELPPQF